MYANPKYCVRGRNSFFHLNCTQYIEGILFFRRKIDFNFTECTPKAVFSRVTKPRVKIPLLVSMSEIKINLTSEKIKFSVSFMLESRKN